MKTFIALLLLVSSTVVSAGSTCPSAAVVDSQGLLRGQTDGTGLDAGTEAPAEEKSTDAD